MINNLAGEVIKRGGELIPLVIDSSQTNGTGLTNPSICKFNGSIYVSLRNVDYILYVSEQFRTKWGNTYSPFAYFHKDTDARLKTQNFLCKLNLENLHIETDLKIDTSFHDTPPKWSFVGHEDGRLISWNEKLYICGVRRDVKPDGEGRMELCELQHNETECKEISRTRIEPPGARTYCEKNWMPVEDMPFHFVKWTSPTEIVKIESPTDTAATSILIKTQPLIKSDIHRDLRGGSQIIRWKQYRIAITHEVELSTTSQGNRTGKYFHRFIVWDLDWNIISFSDDFTFIGNSSVEFVCGMILHETDLLITFGHLDNSAYLLKMPLTVFSELLNLK